MRVLSHNVYWFQGAPSRWGKERVQAVPEVFELLTQFYTAANPDILCLQEVHSAELTETLARQLGMTAWLHHPGGTRPDYGGAILTRQSADLRPGPPCERVHLRASMDHLELAMVHLPSDRFAADPRLAQRAELQRVLATPPRPNIVLGDMNAPPASSTHRFMEEAGYIAAITKHVDYIWLDPTYAERLVSAAALDTGEFYRPGWQLSDHPPLLVELR